ncbi:MAG: hypothetical protein ACI4D9_03975 [Lachnospiraceae bacterium]
MNKTEQERAAIVYFVRSLGLGLKEYFREIPENICTPSIYYPNPEISAGYDTFTSYKNSYVMYVKVIGKNTEESSGIAGEIVNSIQNSRRRIQMPDEKGKMTSKVCVIRRMDVKTIDTGITQVELEWDVRKNMDRPDKIQNFRFRRNEK